MRYVSKRPNDAPERALLKELAAERRRFGYRRLREMARRRGVVSRWDVTALRPEDLLTMSNRLHCYIQTTWPEARPLREVPIQLRMDDRYLSGRIDLVVECADRLVVIDHKTFPGAGDHLLSLAQEHGPQLCLYAEALGRLTSQYHITKLLHFPIRGQLVSPSSAGST